MVSYFLWAVSGEVATSSNAGSVTIRRGISQLSRLLDTTNYRKELSRLIEIAAMLNYEFRWEFRKAA